MKIALFIPCYVDQFYPAIGTAAAHVLRRLGHEVSYPEGQTCCGQPAYNSGFHDEARRVARRFLPHFRDAEAVVAPSGSCAAMVKVFYRELLEGPDAEDAADLAHRTWELSDFLVTRLGVTDVGARFPATVTFHDGCHGLRELHIREQPRALLASVRELTLVEMGEARSCCGFGGAFAVKFPAISTAMAQVKCTSAAETQAEYIVSNDPSCMMQMQGYLDKQHMPVRTIHLAEILAAQ